MPTTPWRPWAAPKPKLAPRAQRGTIDDVNAREKASLAEAPKLGSHSASARAQAARAPIKRPSRAASQLAGAHWADWEQRVAKAIAADKQTRRY